jgi:hypothetical protein
MLRRDLTAGRRRRAASVASEFRPLSTATPVRCKPAHETLPGRRVVGPGDSRGARARRSATSRAARQSVLSAVRAASGQAVGFC